MILSFVGKNCKIMAENLTYSSLGKDSECPYCQEQIDNFESHINASLDNKETSSCGNCDLILKNEQCLMSHVKIAHLNAMKVFSCEACNIDFNSKKSLFIHKDFVHDKIVVKEEVDVASNDVESADDKPFDSVLEIKEEPKVEESVCTSMKQTKILKSDEKRNYKCNQCEKAFNYSSNLLDHEASVHSQARQFKCEECSSTFKLKKTLKDSGSAFQRLVKALKVKLS